MVNRKFSLDENQDYAGRWELKLEIGCIFRFPVKIIFLTEIRERILQPCILKHYKCLFCKSLLKACLSAKQFFLYGNMQILLFIIYYGLVLLPCGFGYVCVFCGYHCIIIELVIVIMIESFNCHPVLLLCFSFLKIYYPSTPIVPDFKQLTT